jgi:hypothetical protein
MGWLTRNCGWVPGKDIFFVSNATKLAVGPTHPLIEYVLGLPALEGKWLGCEAYHFLLTNVEVKRCTEKNLSLSF